ncbi:MAG: peptidase M26, partial [Clostridia bacterium]|nr:peptidase M26 [Clostridia bacterium]
GAVLDPVLRGLIGNGSTIGVGSMLEGLLNARAQDPTSLATGAFAGRVMSNSTVEDCEVEGITVTTVQTTYEQNGKIVGKGGFVGHTEGETTYSGLSNTLGAVGTALSTLLNVIPSLGLGDLITVLLDNALPLGNLIPTGYTSPAITDCTVNNCTLSTEDGKYGVGGFAGSTCGTVITDCTVKNCGTAQNDMIINAEEFGGGFAGVSRDGIIKGTLSGLSIDIAESLHPQSELIGCSIENSHITVTGKKYLGGFVGSLANSYAINDDIDADSTVTVTGIDDGTDESGDCVGGFVGRAQLGSLFDMGEYLVDSSSLLSTVTGLVTGLLGTGSDQALLDLGGVAPSAVMGCQLLGELTVSSGGSYVGGVIGKGEGVYLTSSSQDNLMLLSKYKRGRTALPITAAEARDNYVADLVSVTAGGDYAGGIAGYLTSANVGGLLGSTLGLGQYLGFTVADTTVHGTDGGYTVSADGDCAGGGIGWAVGGDVRDTELEELLFVTANNRAAGFVGATGPGDLVSGEGLDLTLLGISLLSIDNLLSVVSGVRTTYERANVTGVDDGFTVSESGRRTGNDTTIYTAGGFAAEANSVTVDDCHVY